MVQFPAVPNKNSELSSKLLDVLMEVINLTRVYFSQGSTYLRLPVDYVTDNQFIMKHARAHAHRPVCWILCVRPR